MLNCQAVCYTCATGGLLLGDIGGDVCVVHRYLPSCPEPSAQVGGETSTNDERRDSGTGSTTAR